MEFANNPNTDWKKATKCALKKFKNFNSFTLMFLQNHLHWFGTEKRGKEKEKGERRPSINVQPAAVCRSRENGNKIQGRGSLVTLHNCILANA